MDNSDTHKNNATSVGDSRFRGMVESTAGIPWEVDMRTFQFTYVGPQAAHVLGYPAEKWYEENFWPEHIHPDDRESALNLCVEASKKGDDYNFEYRMIHRDGHSVRIMDYVNVVFGEVNGKNIPVRLQGFMFDITEDWQVKQTLRRKNAMLNAMRRASPDMIFIHASDGKILDANDNAIRRYGYSLAEMCSKTIAQLSAAEDSVDNIISHVQAALRGEAPDFEWMAKDNFGIAFPVEVRLRKLEGENDPDAPAIIAVVREISEQKRTENAIKNIAAGVSANTGEKFYHQLVKQLAKLFDADHAIIALIDENSPTNVNTIAVWSMGHSVDNFSYALVNTPCADVLSNSTCCCHPSNVLSLFPQDKVLSDLGAESYIGAPLFNRDKKPIGIISVLDSKPMKNTRHISSILEIFTVRLVAELERENMFQRLQSAQRKLALHVQHTPLAVIEWDTDFRVSDWNKAAENIFGYSKQEAVGCDGRELLLLKEQFHDIDVIWQGLLNNQGSLCSINKNTTKSGGMITCEWYNTPLVTHEGKVIGVASLVADVTARVQAEDELKEHHIRLEEIVDQRTAELTLLNQELKSFSYSVSHDLRAPLRHIDGFSRILLEDFSEQLGEEGQGYLGRVCDRVTYMGQLIDSLLQLSRVTNSELQSVSIDLSAIAEEVVEKIMQNEGHASSTIEIEQDLLAVGDRQLIHAVLQNLLGNAFKYSAHTANGHIQFGKLKRTSHDRHVTSDECVYFIKDNGAGFDMQYVENLFQPFQRLHSEKHFEGSGIGLATVKRIISRHGGRVWAEGEADKGATFFFTLGG